MALVEIMSQPPNTDDNRCITLDKIELQTLADETDRQMREEMGMDEEEEEDEPSPKKLSGILAVAQRYRQSCDRLSREALLEECNAVMQAYEDAEEKDRQERDAAFGQPDEEGFVTVSYNSTRVGSKRDLDEASGDQRRRKAHKRSRKKKKGIGATELNDFYRFQTKENRKKSLHELRQRFEEDLAKVKRMKEERQYRPF
jgi:ribosomal RNA-processing protein 7